MPFLAAVPKKDKVRDNAVRKIHRSDCVVLKECRSASCFSEDDAGTSLGILMNVWHAHEAISGNVEAEAFYY